MNPPDDKAPTYDADHVAAMLLSGSPPIFDLAELSYNPMPDVSIPAPPNLEMLIRKQQSPREFHMELAELYRQRMREFPATPTYVELPLTGIFFQSFSLMSRFSFEHALANI